jgi:hydrogenase-4 component B
MDLFVAGLFVFIAGAAWCPLSRNRMSHVVGPVTAVFGSVLAAAGSIVSLFGGRTEDLYLPWSLPLGSFHIGVDALSAVFVLPVAVISGVAAIYGRGYLHDTPSGRKLSWSWCWFNLFVASMLLVLVARNGYVFLTAWEVMSVTSFFLVLYDHEKGEVGRAGWIYFIAAHIGVAFLLVMFLMLDSSGTMEFSAMAAAGPTATIVFVLGLIGFGAKAGIIPLHVWLPEAHPAAPSHVSSVMSGVMIKLGVYGILRLLLILGELKPWWGWTLVIIGASSGVLGVLYALAQHDLKRLLAYHSVENIGIIFLGLGIGVLGVCSGNTMMAAMGLCGGLLHVWNHAVFKSLLFMGAGAVQHAVGTLQIDRLGGLLKQMPVTGISFLIGSAAISGLPPLNGFVSEFLIYLSSLSNVSSAGKPWAGVVVIASLALIGGLAVACFSKAFGVVFLGEPRSELPKAHDLGRMANGSLLSLAGLCVLMGLSSVWLLQAMLPVADLFLPEPVPAAALESSISVLTRVTIVALALIVATGLVAVLRRRLMAGRSIREDVTWGCGYPAPSPRMQYTASSFAQPIVQMFQGILRPRTEVHITGGLFPSEAHLHTHVEDLFMTRLFRPVFSAVIWVAGGLRQAVSGQIHLHVLFIAVTILLLLFWRLG